MTGQLEEFIGSARWFGGKGREFAISDVRRLPWLEQAAEESDVRTRVELVHVDYGDGGRELYQVPMAYYSAPQDRLAHARIGEWDDEELGRVHVYDALQDRFAASCWLEAFIAAGEGQHAIGNLVFHRLPGHDLDPQAMSALLSAEQSNSSVAFGEDS